VGGRVHGDDGASLTGVATLEAAGPQDLSWVVDERRSRESLKSRAGALLVADPGLRAGKPCVVVGSPQLALALWLEHLHPPERPPSGVAPGSFVHGTAKLGAGASVEAGATVEKGARVGARTRVRPGAFIGQDAVVGDDCAVGPGAAILARCRVGDRCILQPGAVVGSDGFGYVWDGQGHRKVPQVGIARLEDDVEIGANATVDRATLGETVIGRGTKVDNLVQVGHNVIVGEHSILCGQAGIGGSSRLGRGVTLAGQVGVSDHATIGDGAVLTGQAGIARRGRVGAGEVVSGMPALPHREFLKRAALVGKLEAALARIAALEAALKKLEKGGPPWSSGSAKS
jgi:UDP-3-O-[3-hydroxymyristoyl] glucosamine N-acyltransferase